MQARGWAPFRLRGLALLEVLLAGCVLALLATLAAPNFAKIIARLRVNSATEALTTSYYAARAEAFKRGGQVTLAQASSNVCEGGVSGWGCGWLTFSDENGDGRQDPGEQTIFATFAPGGVDVVPTQSLSALTFNAWGRPGGLGALRFNLTSRVARDVTSSICISSGGRVQRCQD